ncbi:MAG: hypothetical protein AVO39_00845 [delta proteobacterium MLS_D]|nr:MAG: hypothetical protein AVO39_00845 [delta proteobacterium MLS_D]
MKIIALGGAGAMGSLSVRELAASPRVEELVIADGNMAAAEALADELGKNCRAVAIDARDHDGLTAALRGFDVAVSTIGPFYKYEAAMIRACIEAGVHYVSICDDYDAAAEALALDDEAKRAGITAVTGVGWTPGITNMLVRLGMETVKGADTAAVYWGCHAADTVGKAVTLHTIHIFTGFVPTFRDGRTCRIPAGSGKEKIRFPDPVGDVTVYHVGHPEPVTLPRNLPLRAVTLKGGLKEQYLNELSLLLNRSGLTSTAGRTDDVGRVVNACLPLLEKITPARETASACRVDVTGKYRGKYSHRALGAVAHMNLLTGLPCAVAAQMIGDGDVSAQGVMGPESCLDHTTFLRRLAEGGIRFFEGEDMASPLQL